MEKEKLITIDYAPYKTEEEKESLKEQMKGIVVDDGMAIISQVIRVI